MRDLPPVWTPWQRKSQTRTQYTISDDLMHSVAPLQLDLTQLCPSLAALCYRSLGVLPGQWVLYSPHQVEWGACIVSQPTISSHNLLTTGRGSLTLGHVVEGWSWNEQGEWVPGVAPAPGCTPEMHPCGYVGFAHVHTPLVEHGPYPGFSPEDYAASLADGDQLAVVCNGPELYALVRIFPWTQPRRIVHAKELASWRRFYRPEEDRRSPLSTPPLSSAQLRSHLLEANARLCRCLGFALYGGPWGRPLQLLVRP